MLRERFRQWRINNKNKTSNLRGATSDGIGFHGTGKRRRLDVLPTTRLERSISTSLEDAPQRLFLSTMDHYFEHAWTSKLKRREGREAVSVLTRITNAIEMIADIDSQSGWAILKKAGMELRQVDWLRLSPTSIIRLVKCLGNWSIRLTGLGGSLRTTVKLFLSRIIGERHPVVLMMETALCGKLDVETCQRYLAIADAKATINASDREEKERINRDTRFAYVRVLRYFNQYERIEEVLNSLSPVSASRQCVKLQYLAEAKRRSGEYDEAERLCSAAVDAFSSSDAHVTYLLSLIRCHVATLLDQNRPEDAVEVFFKGFSLYETATNRNYDPQERAKDRDWLRMDATGWREEYPDFGGLDLVIEKLDAMSLDT
jgi:hypothetical protein